MSLKSNEFFQNFNSDEKSNIRLAKVTQVEDGNVFITFYGEDVQSEKNYKILSSYNPAAGDTVCVLNVNGSWVILGKLSDSYDNQTGSYTSYQLANDITGTTAMVELLHYYDLPGYFTLIPNIDGAIDLGATRKYRNIYAKNGTISTSDERQKENISNLDNRHMELFLKLLPKSYKMIDGTSGRTHIGFVAQDVEKAMNECDISDLDFAGLIRSPVYKVVDGVETDEIEDYMYGLRYEEFIGILTYVLQDVICFLKDLGYRK